MTVHVVGAGVAGLACAVALAAGARRIVVHESATRAGGRARSCHDAKLERVIDNGTHMLVGANVHALRLIDLVGARDEWEAPAPAEFPFIDFNRGDSWRLRPAPGRLPWWLLVPSRRVAGSRLADYLAVLRLRHAPRGATVAQCLGGPLMERLWRPLVEATLNTTPEEASAALFGRVVAETLMKGEAACRPHLARRGLSAALIDPALDRLAAAGGELRLGATLRAIEPSRDAVVLRFDGGAVTVAGDDRAVIALPPWQVAELLPGMAVPTAFRAIVNVHFRLPAPARLLGGLPYLAVVGALPQWLFTRGDVLAITISAADAHVHRPAEDIAAECWRACAPLVAMAGVPLPPWRVIKERRATPAHVPNAPNKTPPRSPNPRLVFAGDWTYPEFPATIEAAAASGFRAADAIARSGHA